MGPKPCLFGWASAVLRYCLTTWLTFFAATAAAQKYSIDWSTISAGGGTLTHDAYSLDGSIVNSSANPGPNYQGYTLEAGFVAGDVASARPQWVLRATNGPSARYANAMAYDSARGVTVMYSGGYVDASFGYTGYGDLWEWDGSHWRQRTTYNWSNAWHQIAGGYWQPIYGDTPAARMQHAMAYDSRRGRVVMFGGRGSDGHELGDYIFNDTWEWDGLSWHFRTTNGPPAEFDHHMAYDEKRGVTILYGGAFASAAQVWQWDGLNWTSVSPTNGPVTSYYQSAGAMDYDPTLGQIFFGPTGDGFTLRFFWSWDGQQWHGLDPGYSQVVYSPAYPAMVFDTYRARSFMFGGQGNGPSGGNGGNTSASYSFATSWSEVTDAAQTSAFVPQDFSDPTNFAARLSAQTDPVSSFLWNQLSNTAAQAVLANPSSTSDQVTAALVPALNGIIHGNSIFDPVRFAGVALSTETTIFQALNPVGTDRTRFNRLLLEDAYPAGIRRSPSTPTGRFYHAMAYDSARHVTVLQGGLYAYPSLVGNETWELLTPDELLINQQPLSQFRQAGDTAMFTVSARSRTGTPLGYQWFFGSQPLADAGRISGSQTPTIQIASVTAGDAGQYHVHVSDDRAVIDSLPARLSLDSNLQIFKFRTFSLLWGISNAVLQHANVPLPGSWNTVPGATSPFDLSGLGDSKFFRLNTNSPAGP